MIIRFHRQFDKHYVKLSRKVQERVDSVLELFQANPLNRVLKNHALKGSLTNKRAISVSGDIRIIFEQHDDYYLVVMLDVGTHNQIY